MKSSKNYLNPYDVGVRKAIALSRESLAPTMEQTHASFNEALAAFGAMLAQANLGRQKGFLNNLAMLAPSGLEAVRAYNKAQKEARDENKILANEHQNYARDEAREAAKAKEYAIDQEWKQKNFDELVRGHNLLDRFRKDKIAGEKQAAQGILVGGKNFSPLDKTEIRDAHKIKTNTGNSLLAVKEAGKKWEDLNKKTKNNFFKPIGGFSFAANPVKDWTGQLLDIKSLQEETALRKQLKADLGNLNVVLEKGKTGKGLTQGMYDRLKAYYPDIDNDDLETIKMKMAYLTKEAETYYKAAQLRAAYGANIDPSDVEDLDFGSEQQPPSSHPSTSAANSVPRANNALQQSEGLVKMIHSDTGDIREVKSHLVKDMENLGFTQVNNE